jgi:hypothetical protein
MLTQLSKFETEVHTLYLQNKSISSISTTLENSSHSITNTLYRSKQKNKTILSNLQRKLGRPTKITKRIKTLVNRDLTRSPKKTNKRILEENSLGLSTRSLQRLLREENYSTNTAKRKPLLNRKKATNRLVYTKQTLKNLKI